MADGTEPAIPPLQGCLYCHAEGAVSLSPGRRILGFGGGFPVLKCRHCDSVALLDYDPARPHDWRICYRRINRSARYYYAAIHLGKAGWLTAQKALEISTASYVQRMRVQQARAGDLAWLRPAPLRPPPPLMGPDEIVYLALKGVTLQEVSSPALLARPGPVTLLDSGKFYVTDQKLHLLGQRRDWSHRLTDIAGVRYDERSWTIDLNTLQRPQQYRGMYVADQWDPQLVAAIVDHFVQR